MKTQKQRIFSILAILSLVVILSFIFVACNSKGDQSSEKPDMEATEIYKSVDPSVAFLLVQKKDGSYASGSGFFIDPHGTLVTNYHVIEDGIKCAVQMKNGNTVEVKTVVSYDEDADLAILATKVANTKPITESKSLPQVGETVYAIGYPEAFKLGIASSTFTSGIVSSYRTMDGNEYIQSTVNITHGNSGGVLINKKGDVVGITSSGITYGDIDYMNLSIPISKIHNLAVESNEPLDVVTARHYPVYATFYAHDLVFDKQELDYENTADYPGTVQKEGYTFDGWYADKAFTQEWDFSTQITKDTAIFAKLDPIYFSLNLDLNGGVWASNNPGDKYYIKNCEKALPIPKKTGYMFDGWTDSNGNYIDNYPSYSNARTLTLTANWVEGTPGLTFQLNDDGTATVTACDKSKSNIVIPTIYRGHKVASIAPSAFKDCKSLQSVTISENISSIGSYAFNNCTSLRSIVWKPTEKVTFGSYICGNCTNINLIIDDSVANIAGNAFQYQTWFSSITIPDSLTSIGSSAFYESSDLTNVYYTGDIASWCRISGIGSVMSTSTTLYIGGNKVCGDLTIPDGVTSIPGGAFRGCSGLTSIIIPDSVTNIGGSAFSGCSGLTSVTICNSVMSIGNWAFYKCSGLTSVTIGNGVTSIGEYAFYGCTGLTTVNWNATECTSAGSYGNPIFNGCSNLATVNIGDNVTTIPSYAFRNCSGLTSVMIGNGVTSIGYDAFSGYSKIQDIYITDIAAWCNISGLDNLMRYGSSNKNLYLNNELATSITIPNGVTTIPSSAFSGCSRLTSITIPDSVTSIGYSAFSGCSSLESITIPFVGAKAGVTSSDTYRFPFGYIFGRSSYDGGVETKQYDYAYSSSSKMSTTYYIPSSLKSVTVTGGNIWDYAFYDCSSLTSVAIVNSVTSIGFYAFHGCTGLTSVTIGNSVGSIDWYAFECCSGLTSVTIGNSVGSIGRDAFSGCAKLKTVFYAGTEEQWKAIYISSTNSSLTSATRVYNYDGVERTYSFVTNCDESVDPVTAIYLSTLPTVTKEGWYFGGWYDNAEFAGNAIAAPYCNKDKTTLYAKWLTEEEWLALRDGTSFEKAFIAKSGQTYDVSIKKGGQIVYFVFSPTTSGSFTIQSTGSGDTYGTLYSSSKSSLKTSDDDGDGNNFKITYTMTAGTTYYVAVKFYGSSTTGTFKVSFS